MAFINKCVVITSEQTLIYINKVNSLQLSYYRKQDNFLYANRANNKIYRAICVVGTGCCLPFPPAPSTTYPAKTG